MRKNVIAKKLNNINSALRRKNVAAEFKETYVDLDKVDIYLKKGTEKVLVAKELSGIPAETFLTDIGRIIRILPAWEIKLGTNSDFDAEKSAKELEVDFNILWERLTGYRRFWEIRRSTVKGKDGTVLLLTDSDSLQDESAANAIALSLVRVLNSIRVKHIVLD